MYELLVALLLGLVILGRLIYLYWTAQYDKWKNKGIPHVRPAFPFGCLKPVILGEVHMGKAFQDIYDTLKGHRFGGFCGVRNAVLMIRDPELIKHILTKDFHIFMDRGMFPKAVHDILNNHLFNMEGNEWKDMRSKLSPTFTSGKMKMMFPLMEHCSQQFKEHLHVIAKHRGVVDVKDFMARFTTDIIATCAFGLDCNSISNPDNQFFQITTLIFKLTKLNMIKGTLLINFPCLFNALRLTIVDKRVCDFLTNVIESTVSYRKETNLERADFIELLMNIKSTKDEGGCDRKEDEITDGNQINNSGLTLQEMVSQTFLFFAAGFETAASTISFCLYELSCHKEVQHRLREEVDHVISEHHGQLTYQSLQEMEYMDQVINETLRLYASLPFITRRCNQSYRLAGSDLVLEKGTKVLIPTYAIHHDPEYYPHPYNFDPDRFTKENINKRHHYTYIPFGEGPRMCLGMRFGKMQVKMGLATILSNFQLELAPDTPVPMEISSMQVVTTPLHPIKLRFSLRAHKI